MESIVISTIKQAARQRLVLRIIYLEKDGTSEGWRYIEPYSFSHDDSETGLFAWDQQKEGIRRFSLVRISKIEISDKSYTARYAVEI
jgi:predicted DNA-binding transcriptional regulator YafY